MKLKHQWLLLALLAFSVGIICLFIGLIYQEHSLVLMWGYSVFLAESIVAVYALYRSIKLRNVNQ